MGINIILPLIMGIVMTVILGTQVAPSLVENMKIAKVENRTISNQNLIKDAIVRYIKMEKKVPKDLEELKTYGILKDYHESNIFGGGYSFTIDKKKGTLKIFTTINDDGAGKYFSNSFKFPNKPICIEFDEKGACTGKFETFYLLDDETFKSIPIPEVGSTEWADENYTIDNLGKKLEEGKELEYGYVDYVKEDDKIIEYIYDKTKNEWVKGEENTFEENKYVAGIIAPEKLYNYWLSFQTIKFNSYSYNNATECFSSKIEFYHYYEPDYDKFGFPASWLLKDNINDINTLKSNYGFNDNEIEIFKKRQFDRMDILKVLFKDILSPTILDIKPIWSGSIETTTSFKTCGNYLEMLSEVEALENEIKEIIKPTCDNRTIKIGSQQIKASTTKQQYIDYYENPDYFCPNINIKNAFVQYIDTKFPSIK